MGDRNQKTAGIVVAGACLLFSCNTVWATCDKWAAKIASVQGSVEAKRINTSKWKSVRLNENFCAGDQIRVNTKSRAAVVLANETLLRLDQNSAIKLTAIKPKETSVIDLFKGIGHFISRVPRSLKVETPTMNAAIEGTEFVVAIYSNETRLTVFEGTVLVSNKAGNVKLTNGESAIASRSKAPVIRILAKPRDAVQWALYYPPILDTSLRSSDPVYRAASLLNKGRVKQASQILDRAANNGSANALQSIIAVVNNDKHKALNLARLGVQLSPDNAATYIALSYAQQANFDLDAALISAQQATIKDGSNALAWARVAELQLSLGMLDDALASAKLASEKSNKLSRTQTILGYAHLLQIDIDEAKQAFTNAIKFDQTDPLPRLGIGLAKIRENKLHEGRREIEIAASLDPNNAIVRSYLGKAYFEEKRSPLDTEQFDMAKGLDSNDPTPWFYDAIAKQSENRPVEALESLQRSIELNDNRAVYRSKLQLDRDIAARNSSQSRIYNNLGFKQLSLQQATRSLIHDPSNHSAHRLLADVYANMPRHENARVSELLQAQLLQPISNIAIQPYLAESTLATTNNLGSSQLSFHEFNPLFVRDGMTLQVNSIHGSNNTQGGDAVISAIASNVALSIGYYNFSTDGFRDNNDLEEEVSNAIIQYDITPSISIQAEKRRHKKEYGDIELSFDPDDYSLANRNTSLVDTDRVGGRIEFTQNSTLLFSHIESERDAGLQSLDSPPYLDENTLSNGKQTELRYSYNNPALSLLAGFRKNKIREPNNIVYDWTDIFGDACPPPFFGVPCEEDSLFNGDHKSAYVYSDIKFSNHFIWTLGLSHDELEYRTLSINQTSPKMGLTFALGDNTLLRASYVEAIKKPLIIQQTLEPTSVSGFNQFFDDHTGTNIKQHGINLSTKTSNSFSTGLEYTMRDLELPAFTATSVDFETREDKQYSLYFNWVLSRNWVLNGEYLVTDISNQTGLGPEELETKQIPIHLHFSHHSGFIGELTITRVSQDVQLPSSSSFTRTSENFTIVDLNTGFRLPNRQGLISLEIRNLLDEEFIYQDINYIRSEAIIPGLTPERTIMGRLTLSF